MKTLAFILVLILGGNYAFSQTLGDLSYGEDNTLEVITWNVEYFPKGGQTTIDSLITIIQALDVDVLALQEIDVESSFTQLLGSLPGWDGYHVPGSWPSLAYLYKSSVIDVDTIYEIYKSYDREFPRAPLVMEMKFRNQRFIIINNHLKCCGNNSLNHSDPDDEEKRRYDANILLDQWIVANFPNDRVIMLGDLNDVLTDVSNNNVFQMFLDDTASYKFVDVDIAQGTSSSWSYPSWPSHLDHIMISNELFAEFTNDSSDIQTIKMDTYLPGGWGQYDNLLTDHRPVALKLQINPSINIVDAPLAICNGDSISIYGSFESTSGTYYDSLTSVGGWDSVHSTILTVSTTYFVDPPLTIVSGDSISIYGIFRLTAGVYFDSTMSVDGCDSIRSTVLTVNPTSISEINQLKGISIWPNPSSGRVLFHLSEQFTNSRIEIFNMSGQKITSISTPDNYSPVTWYNGDLPAGVYYVQLISRTSSSAIQKLVIVR